MPEFIYKATTLSGQTVEGLIEGKDEDAVVHNLHHLGYIPIRVLPIEKKGLRLKFPSFASKRVGLKNILIFTEELHSLLSSGLPIDRSLRILGNVTENKNLKKVIMDLLTRLEGGSSFSEALSYHPKIFSKLYINMVKAGESGGFLETILLRLAQYLRTIKEIRDYIISVTIYPLILTIVSGISIIILVTFVIPRFSRIFSDIGQAIPMPTHILLTVSYWFRWYWWVGLGIILFSYILKKIYTSTEHGSLKWDQFKLKCYVIGEIIKRLEVARFSRTLGTLLKSGISILSALNLVKEISKNRAFATAITHLHDRLREGHRISKSLLETAIFPALAIHMIEVGEETGRLDEMLIKIADTYEENVQKSVKRFVSLLEPIIILVMGCVVGFIVISMLLAIFSINEIPF